MKKIFRLVLSLFLVCLVITSLVLPAAAATISKATHTSNTYGKNVTIFYVKSKSTGTTTLNYSCTKGSFVTKQGSLRSLNGYYEVLVYGKNSSGGWTYLSKTNIKNSASTTLSMKGYTEYKVRVYSWNTTTIGSYLGGVYNSSNAAWWSAPTCTFTAKSNVSSLNN